MYRRGAEQVVGRRIAKVDAPDDWYLKGCDAAEIDALLTASTIVGTDRIGKLLLLETDNGPLGLRFGMTGRLVVDDVAVIASLEYSSKRLDADWNRFGLHFEDGGSLVMNDPRRLGGVAIDPDRSTLGPDAWSIELEVFRERVGRRTTAIKALLLDQRRIAGLGNLLADELLWRVGVSPSKPCDEIGEREMAELAVEIGPMLDDLYGRGGSHLGDHVDLRDNGARCSRDGAPMAHGTIGGRSTWWCTKHQS